MPHDLPDDMVFARQEPGVLRSMGERPLVGTARGDHHVRERLCKRLSEGPAVHPVDDVLHLK